MFTTSFIPDQKKQAEPTGFGADGCYIGSLFEQEAAIWLAEVVVDFEAVDEINKLAEEYEIARREAAFDDAADERMRKANQDLQAVFARAARLALN